MTNLDDYAIDLMSKRVVDMVAIFFRTIVSPPLRKRSEKLQRLLKEDVSIC